MNSQQQNHTQTEGPVLRFWRRVQEITAAMDMTEYDHLAQRVKTLETRLSQLEDRKS